MSAKDKTDQSENVVEEECLKLYPERKGERYETPFYYQLWGHKSAAHNKLKCEQNIVHAMNDSPLVKLLLSAIEKTGCKLNLRNNFSCEYCGPEVTGGYDPSLNQIVVCYNHCGRAKTMGVLTHELIHMFDYCRAEMDFNNLEHIACSEIRAANLAHCSFLSGWVAGSVSPLRPAKAHAQCVKQKAVASVLAVRPNMDKRKAWNLVDKVFDKCYNDLEPIGRRVRRNSKDMHRAYRERHLYGY